MGRLLTVSILLGVLVIVSACQRQQPSIAHSEEGKGSVPEYFRANHGYNGGLKEMVDLRNCEGFDALKTKDDVARFAAEIPGAIGFTLHPEFEKGARYAEAVLWYTKLSSMSLSWGLYLFDKQEAEKSPGDTPRPEAVAAAEAKVSAGMEEARKMIDEAGAKGVNPVGDYEEKKALALAVMHLDGKFEHFGEYGTDSCGGCRTVVSGGTPEKCGHGVANEKHWTCCGSTEESGYCQYWELIKAQDDRPEPLDLQQFYGGSQDTANTGK
jgi:hypothetical protein